MSVNPLATCVNNVFMTNGKDVESMQCSEDAEQSKICCTCTPIATTGDAMAVVKYEEDANECTTATVTCTSRLASGGVSLTVVYVVSHFSTTHHCASCVDNSIDLTSI